MKKTPAVLALAATVLLGTGLLFALPVISVPNLVAYYRLDEAAGTTAADDSGSGLDGTWAGGPTPNNGVPPAGPPGIGFTNPNSLAFDGVDDVVDLGTSATLNPANAMTIAAWMYPTDVTGEKKVICKWADAPVGDFTYFVNLNTGIPNFYVVTTVGQANATGTAALAANTWSHVVVSYDSAGGADNLKVYINAGAPGQATQTGTIRQGGPLVRLGAGSGTPVSGEEPYVGRLDDVRFYDRALTPAEVTTLYQGQLPPAVTVTASDNQNGQITVSWTASAGAASYVLRRGTAMGGPFGTTLTTTTGTNFVDTPVAGGTTYWYQVAAVNIVGESLSAPESGVSTSPPPNTNDDDEGTGGCECGTVTGPGSTPWAALSLLALLLFVRRRQAA